MTVLAQSGGTMLRRLQTSDQVRFWQTRQDPDLARYQGWSPISGAEAQVFLSDVGTAGLFDPDQWCQIGIAATRAPQILLGDIGLFLNAERAEVELGITLSRDAQGRGHAQRAIDAVLHLVWTQSPALTVVGISDARNHASIQLMNRMGFTPLRSSAAMFQGQPCTETLHALRRPGHAVFSRLTA